MYFLSRKVTHGLCDDGNMARPLLELWCVFQADCFSALVELMETAKDSSDDHYVISFSDTCWSWCPHVMHHLPLS
jgi:hypothetical protein